MPELEQRREQRLPNPADKRPQISPAACGYSDRSPARKLFALESNPETARWDGILPKPPAKFCDGFCDAREKDPDSEFLGAHRALDKAELRRLIRRSDEYQGAAQDRINLPADGGIRL